MANGSERDEGVAGAVSETSRAHIIIARLTALEAGQNAMNGALGLMLDTLQAQTNLLRRLHEFAKEEPAESPATKILRDVFEPGDRWFRTGDLMRKDHAGYYTFADRLGDTFRWKGENVATSEVSEALSSVPGIREVNVYGVAVAGMDGRAGMAALVVDGGFDIAGLAHRLEGRLAHYARPVFLRLQPQIAVTGTFKQRKVELVKEGFDPSALPDPIYWLDPATATYERLTPERYAEIVEDRVKI